MNGLKVILLIVAVMVIGQIADWRVAEVDAVLSDRDRKHPMLAEMSDLF